MAIESHDLPHSGGDELIAIAQQPGRKRVTIGDIIKFVADRALEEVRASLAKEGKS